MHPALGLRRALVVGLRQRPSQVGQQVALLLFEIVFVGRQKGQAAYLRLRRAIGVTVVLELLIAEFAPAGDQGRFLPLVGARPW